ncbi:MAG: hypothetical protein FWF09_03735 [Bacteroidales bacterium]|nr:hypothetical protein [Bacteroidales bacterium]
MAVVEVTSRQFRDNQRSFFDLADEGKQIVIKRRSRQAYTLTPVGEDDWYLTPELEARIEKSLQQIENGEYTVIKNKEELHQYFDNL